MPGGRPPKPAEQKRLLGNPGKRPLAAPAISLPAARKGVPSAPKGLGTLARRLWKQLWTVGRAWLSPDVDAAVVARLCASYEEEAELRTVIAAEGRFATGSMGQLVTHPAVLQLRAVQAQIARDEAQCGFGPVNRSRLGIAAVKQASKLEEFLARRRANDEAQD